MVRVAIKIATKPVNGRLDTPPDVGWKSEKIGVEIP
jgi:hypothetical protein